MTTVIQAQVEVFLTAFHALPDAAQRELRVHLLAEVSEVDLAAEDAHWDATTERYPDALKSLITAGLTEIDAGQTVDLGTAIDLPVTA